MSQTNVLVAIMNNLQDFAIARDQHWYRIPVSSAQKWVKNRWPPRYLAFYHTKIFGQLAYGVHYFARVINVREARRWELFPEQPNDHRSHRRYYQLRIGPLQSLPNPILSKRWRRIVFIPTTWTKLMQATEINDLYDDSPLEDHMWTALKRRDIQAERQEFVRIKNEDYALDFAIYCVSGKLDIETDGDLWHANPERAAVDNVRDNSLTIAGWDVLRFTTAKIQDEMETYCIPNILEKINKLDGLDEGRLIPTKFDLKTMDRFHQLGLFDRDQGSSPTGDENDDQNTK